MTKILALHGINHNMFGKRDPVHYGTVTLEDIYASIESLAKQLGVEVENYQTNEEGAICLKIHQALLEGTDAIMINAGAWTHYSYGLRDALAIFGALAPLTVAADLRSLAGCESVHSAVSQRFGRCDVLVTSAGATRAGAFLTQSDAEWQDGFALKFYSCVRLCRLFWPMLRTAQGGIINIIGGAARTPDPEFLVGGSVNAAVANFTKGLSGLGKRDGVNVNSILPGLTETERVKELFEQRAKATGILPDQARDNAIAKEGIRRLGQPEDIAELAVFLASDRARHIQGTAIAVDGGGTPGLY